MASSFSRCGSSAIRSRNVLLLGILATFAPTAVGQETVTEDLCPWLSSERRVSYKHQEAKLFHGILDRVAKSPVQAPTTRDAVRAFGACLARFRERSERGEDDPLAQVRLTASTDWAAFDVASAQSPPNRYRIRGKLVDLAKRVTQDLVEQSEPSVRDELRNRLWFLWIESYLRATGEKHNSYDFASDLIAERAMDSGRSFSVGFEIEEREERFHVSAVSDRRLRDSGLATGDEIVAIDERRLHDLTVPELQRYWFSREPFSFTATARREAESFAVAGESVPVRHETTAWSIRGDLG